MTDESKRQGRLRVIALVTIIALVLGLTGGWIIAAATTSSDNGDVWVVQSQTATVAPDSITLNQVGGSVILVSVEDGNEVDAVSVSQLVQDWDDEFGDQRPRAVIAGVADSRSQSVIVELGKPTATADSITFEGSTIIGGDTDATDLNAATLLIDNEGLVEAKLKSVEG
jgi:hypothetical protein